MIGFAYIVLFGMPLVGALYLLGTRATPRHVAVVVVFSWLLLPLLGVKLTDGIPLYDKAMAVGMGGFLGVLISRLDVLARLRPRWLDLPIAVWCLVPIASSLSNGLGLYDGLSGAFRQTVVWGLPYAIGRSVFAEPDALVDLAKVLLVGGVVYFPLCLFESKMSPQLHLWVYGVPGRVGWETVDFFGPLRSKPSVFLESPLELTPLMGAMALCGFWLWRAGGVRKLGRWGMGWLTAAAAGSAVLGKSLGGFTLTVAGLAILLSIRRWRLPVLLMVVTLAAPAYMVVRSGEVWSGRDLVSFIADYISVRRAESLNGRMWNEDILVAKALERPLFGWGGWGRARVYDDEGRDISTTDGMWVIAIGNTGLVGLSAYYAMLLLPVVGTLKVRGRWLVEKGPEPAAVLVMATLVVLHSVDDLFNAMPNPVWMVAAGGLAGIALSTRASYGAGSVARPASRAPTTSVEVRTSAVRDARAGDLQWLVPADSFWRASLLG